MAMMKEKDSLCYNGSAVCQLHKHQLDEDKAADQLTMGNF